MWTVTGDSLGVLTARCAQTFGGGEVEKEGGVVAESVPPRAVASSGGAPDMLDAEQPALQVAIEERLIEPEAVATVGRVPSELASIAVEQAEGVGPAGGLHGLHPAILTAVEGGRLFVDTDATRVGVSDQQGWAGSPTRGDCEGALQERRFAPAGTIGDVDGGEGDGRRGGDVRGKPAVLIGGGISERGTAERGTRRDEEAVAGGMLGAGGRALMGPSGLCEGLGEGVAGWGVAELAQGDDLRRPANDLVEDAVDAPPATGADVPSQHASRGWVALCGEGRWIEVGHGA